MAQQQAEQVIDIPGVGRTAFPASMTEAEMNAAATRLYQEANPGKKQPPVKTWTDTAVSWIPTAGSVIGGAMGAEAGPVGIAAGAGAGGALGKAIQQKINVMRGVTEAPATVLEALTPVAMEGGADAAMAGLGGAVLSKPARVLAGRGLDKLGMELERVGVKGVTKALNEDVAQAAGRAVQSGARALAGAPNEASMIQGLMNAATRPQNAVKLSAYESKFLADIEQRLINQGSLTLGQRSFLKTLYRAKYRP